MSWALILIVVGAVLWLALTAFVTTCIIQSVQDEDRYGGG